MTPQAPAVTAERPSTASVDQKLLAAFSSKEYWIDGKPHRLGITPMLDNVVVRYGTRQECLGTSLDVVTTKERDKFNRQGRVIAVGIEQCSVAPGDWVWFAEENADTIDVAGEKLLVLQPSVRTKGRVMLVNNEQPPELWLAWYAGR